MRCERMATLRLDVELGLATDADRVRLARHAASCRACAAAIERETTLTADLRALAAAPAPEIAVLDRVRSSIAGMPRPTVNPGTTSWIAWGLSASLAAVAILAGIAARFLPSATEAWPSLRAGAGTATAAAGALLRALAGILEPTLVPLRWIALRAAELVADPQWVTASLATVATALVAAFATSAWIVARDVRRAAPVAGKEA